MDENTEALGSGQYAVGPGAPSRLVVCPQTQNQGLYRGQAGSPMGEELSSEASQALAVHEGLMQ